MRSIEFSKITDLLARQHKVRVQEGNDWAANLKDRVIFYRKKDIYNLPEDQILGLLLHEIAHIHYTNPNVKLPTINPELTHYCLNMLEDIAIENIISKDYPNAGEILKDTKQEILNTLIRMLPKADATLHEKALLFAAARFEGRGYAYSTEKYEKIGEEISKLMLNQKQEILERKKTENLLPLAEEIIKILIQRLGQPPPSDLTRISNEAFREHHASGENYGAHQGTTVRGIASKGIAGKGWFGQGDGIIQVQFIDKIADQAVKIGRELRSILKQNNALEYGGRYRSGKLITKRLIRIKTAKDKKPFGKRIIKCNKSYAFAAASDISGSMFNSCKGKNDADYALSSLYMVGEALKTAGVPRSLAVFGRETVIVNPINKLAVRWEDIATDRILKKAGQNSTHVHLAINKCHEQLKKIKCERKILIILTDGNSDRNSMEIAYKKAKKDGIQCIGISIGRNSPEMEEIFDKENYMPITDISNMNAIGEAFIKILRTTITKYLQT